VIAESGHASKARDLVLIGLPPRLGHAVHGQGHGKGVPGGHLTLSELDHSLPDLVLTPSSEQNVHLIEAEFSVEEKRILLLRPVGAVVVPVVLNHEARCIRSRGREWGWLIKVGRLSPVRLHDLEKPGVVQRWKCRFRRR
jgi:hypothetical protein